MNIKSRKGFCFLLCAVIFLANGSVPAYAGEQTTERDIVCSQLEGALKKAGLYQNESGPVEYTVVYETRDFYYVRVAREEGPAETVTLNSYAVQKKDGDTVSAGCNQHFKLDLSKSSG